MASISTITLPNGSQYDFKDADARAQLTDKVDKVSGKGLSTEDFTSEEKTKLAGIATGATANVGTVTSVRVQATAPITSSTSTAQTSTLNTTIGINAASQSAAGSMSAADKTKLDKVTIGSTTSNVAIDGTSSNHIRIRVTDSNHTTTGGAAKQIGLVANENRLELYDYTMSAEMWSLYPNTAISPIEVTNGVIGHATSGVTAGTKGTNNTTALTPAFGGTFNVIGLAVNDTGHITSANSHTVKIPNTAATSDAAGLMSAADKAKVDKLTISSAAFSAGVVSQSANALSIYSGWDDSALGDYIGLYSVKSDDLEQTRFYVGEDRLRLRSYDRASTSASFTNTLVWDLFPPTFYQTNNSANTSLSSGTITRVVLTATNKISEGSGFSIASGGIKVANAGTYRVSGSIYINSASGQTSRGAYIYVGTSTTMSNNTQVCEALYAGSASGAIAIAPKMITVAENQIVFLAARSQGAASSVPASQAGTYLLVERVA